MGKLNMGASSPEGYGVITFGNPTGEMTSAKFNNPLVIFLEQSTL